MQVKALKSFAIKLEPDQKPVYITEGHTFDLPDRLVDDLFDNGTVSLLDDAPISELTVAQIALDNEVDALLKDIKAPEDMSLAELKNFAAENNIDISGASKKQEVLDIITAALSAGE